MTTRIRLQRPMFVLMLAALFAGLLPFGASAADHTATRTEVTFNSNTVEVLRAGEEYVDEAGIFHLRNEMFRDEVSGDISGTAIITFNADVEPIGECSEESCPGYATFWADIVITTEDGGWEGTYVFTGSDVPGEEFAADGLVLRGTGANAHKSIAANVIDEQGESVTFEGVLSTLAMPLAGLNTDVNLCADPETFAFAGGYLGSGAVEGHGAATGEFVVGGGPWTHTYAVSGMLTLTGEHGSLTIAFSGAVQDNYMPTFEASHVFGHFVILEGSGEYAELYGSGRIVGTAGGPMAGCASEFGITIAMVGEAHYN